MLQFDEMPTQYLGISLATGEIFTLEELFSDFVDTYDGGDVPAIMIFEYYKFNIDYPFGRSRKTSYANNIITNFWIWYDIIFNN